LRPRKRWLSIAKRASLANSRSDEKMRETLALRSDQEVRDFVRGCTFYGTGGGGSPKYGYGILSRVLKERKRIPVFDPDSIAGDDWTVCAYGMGSIAPRTPEILEEMKRLLRDFVRDGDVVLFKGSRGMRMERLVEALGGPRAEAH